MNIEKTTYKGWTDAYRLTNDELEMVVLTEVGPRIISLSRHGGENILFEDPSTLGKGKADSQWHIYGGHRLWIGPEREETYAPDNSPCDVEADDDTFIATAAIDPFTKLESCLKITPGDDGCFVIDHIVKNTGEFLQNGALWALTCVKPKGLVCFPWGRPGEWQMKKIIYWKNWSNHTSKIASDQWQAEEDLFVIEPSGEEGKVGTANYEGWMALVREDCTFIKKFDHVEGADYPDDNCSMETYTCEDFVEMETLSPWSVFYPQEAITHRERWYLTDKTVNPAEVAGVRELL